MTDPAQPPRFPAWLAPTVVVLMAMQLTLSWLQGGLIHRQNQELAALREDVQDLADSLDQGIWEGDYEEQGLPPAHHNASGRKELLRVRMAQTAPADEEQAQKDLQAARTSAQEAVSKAREVQAKLSIAENIRKAEAKAKAEESGNAWLKWLWIALGTGLLALGVRSWLRREG